MKWIVLVLLFNFLQVCAIAEDKKLDKKGCLELKQKFCKGLDLMTCVKRYIKKDIPGYCIDAISDMSSGDNSIGRCTGLMSKLCSEKNSGPDCMKNNAHKIPSDCRALISGPPKVDVKASQALNACQSDFDKFCPMDMKKMQKNATAYMAEHSKCIQKYLYRTSKKCQKAMGISGKHSKEIKDHHKKMQKKKK